MQSIGVKNTIYLLMPEVIELTGYDTRKVFADVYVDDKSCPAKVLELRQFSNLDEKWQEKLA